MEGGDDGAGAGGEGFPGEPERFAGTASNKPAGVINCIICTWVECDDIKRPVVNEERKSSVSIYGGCLRTSRHIISLTLG